MELHRLQGVLESQAVARDWQAQTTCCTGAAQVVREANLLEAGGRLPASVRAISGGDPDEPTEEIIASSIAQQLQLGVQALLQC